MKEKAGSRTKRKRPRTCAGCGEELPKKTLVRIVRTPSGEVKIDPTGKANGRGAYLCRDLNCVAASRSKNTLARALKTKVDGSVYDELERICSEGFDDE